MNKPFYIRQAGDLHDPEEARAWADKAAKEARSEGATLLRWTKHPDIDGLYLMEGWKEFTGDQGEPRFFLTKGEAGE